MGIGRTEKKGFLLVMKKFFASLKCCGYYSCTGFNFYLGLNLYVFLVNIRQKENIYVVVGRISA